LHTPWLWRIRRATGRHGCGSIPASRRRPTPPSSTRSPRTPLDAKFSAEFTVACALARGHVELGDFTQERVVEPAVQSLLRKVRVQLVAEQDCDEPIFSPADQVIVRLRGGSTLEAEPVRRALGHASRPIDDAALHQKFMGCAGFALDAATARRWWDAAMAPADEPVRWPG